MVKTDHRSLTIAISSAAGRCCRKSSGRLQLPLPDESLWLCGARRLLLRWTVQDWPCSRI